MIPKTYRRVVLARRPPAEPAETDFRIEEVPMPEPGPGQVLVRVIYMSLDPYMRGRMRDVASYAPPVGIGEAMTGGTVGEVVKSNHPGLKVGDIVEDRLGWGGEGVENGNGNPGVAARRVDGELGGLAQPADALAVLIPTGEALLPKLGLLRGEVRGRKPFLMRLVWIHPWLEVRRAQIGKGE